jgi:hypothetical protein
MVKERGYVHVCVGSTSNILYHFPSRPLPQPLRGGAHLRDHNHPVTVEERICLYSVVVETRHYPHNGLEESLYASDS